MGQGPDLRPGLGEVQVDACLGETQGLVIANLSEDELLLKWPGRQKREGSTLLELRRGPETALRLTGDPRHPVAPCPALPWEVQGGLNTK